MVNATLDSTTKYNKIYKMIDFYTFKTFNGQQISIALEELGLEYTVHKIDLFKGEQHEPSFLKINPSGRIPAIVDHSTKISTGRIVVSQSMAILIYLAEKSHKLLSKEPEERAKTIEWLAFQVTDISTNIFNSFFLKSLIKVPQLEASKILRQRALSFYKVFDQQLHNTEYLTGDNYTIADISSFAVVNSIISEIPTEKYRNLNRWYQSISKRPAVIAGLKIPE